VAFVIGVVVLAVWASGFSWSDPWRRPARQILVAVPVVGLLIIFVSVLRERLFQRKSTRYSRGIQR